MEIYGITLPSWVPEHSFLLAALTIFGFWIISRIVIFICEKVILAITSKTKTEVDEKIVKAIVKPLSLIMLVIGTIIALDLVIPSPDIARYVRLTLISFIILIVGFMLIRILSVIIKAWGTVWAARTDSDLDDQLVLILNKLQKLIVLVLAVLMILQFWDIEIGPLLASLGIAGIAVAFALQNTLGNIFGGISLIIDKAIKVGDVVKLADGTYGRVMEVGLRSTRIKTWSNELMIIPNGELANKRIQNYILPDETCRAEVAFGVAYGSDPDKVEQVALDVLKKFDIVLKEPEPACCFESMGDFSLNYTLKFWVKDFSDKYAAELDVRKALYNALYANNIDIPFPTHTIYLKDEEGNEYHQHAMKKTFSKKTTKAKTQLLDQDD